MHTPSHRFQKLLAGLLTAMMVSCVSGAEPVNALQQISLSVSPDLPPGFRAEVDILFVYDTSLLNRLPFTQFEWISDRDQYLRDSIADIEIVQLTVTPESQATTVPLPTRHGEAVGILVFASHEDPVAEAIDITEDSTIVLQIEDYGINVITN